MKLNLTKTETNAVVGVRLLGSARGREAGEIQKEINALEQRRDALLAEVNTHAAEVFSGIAEDNGLDGIPMKHTFAKAKDGTSTLEWADAPVVPTAGPKGRLGREAEKRAAVNAERARLEAELVDAGVTPEALAELAKAEPLPPVSPEALAAAAAPAEVPAPV